MNSNLLVLDTETTGLSVAKGSICIEVAAILYSIEHREMIQCVSTLIRCETNEAESINGIKPAITQCKMDSSFLIKTIGDMAIYSDAMVAHNASFDVGFLKTLPDLGDNFSNLPVICTKNDFRWPSNPARLRLMDICASLDIPYVDAHRALSDCELLAACLSKVPDLQERIDDILKMKASPKSDMI